MPGTPVVSVVIPCYNEAGNIPALLERFRSLRSRLDFELVLVDNGSTDGTPAALAAALAAPGDANVFPESAPDARPPASTAPGFSFVKTVRVEKNIGYGHGIQEGLKAAAARTVAVTHADLQCPPEDLVKAMDLYEREQRKGPCLVKGRRLGRPPLDRCVTWGYNRLAAAILGVRAGDSERPGQAPSDVNAQPKVFDRSLIPALLAGTKDFTFDLFILHCCRRLGIAIVEFEVDYLARAWGKSKLAANPWVRLKTSANAAVRMVRMRLGDPPVAPLGPD
ncbi:MAG: glycosyltransferase family 2 protein [Elusimicrobia bacterium]|nr:glycosyltransferase family 2 protein [Elusimicrobiota bacterium]